MNINSVNNSAGAFKSQNVKQKDSQKLAQDEDLQRAGRKQSDSLEISNEARKLQPVLQKVEEGFYDRPEVIRQVARKINEEIKADDK